MLKPFVLKNTTLKGNRAESVNSLKEKIGIMEAIPSQSQWLLFTDKQIEDSTTLEDDCIVKGSTLSIHLSLRGGMVKSRYLSSSTPSSPPQPTLFKFIGKRFLVVMTQVPVALSSLNQNDSFVLQANSQIYIFSGPKANMEQRTKCLEVANSLLTNPSRVVDLNDNNNNFEFWSHFGGIADPNGLPLGSTDDRIDPTTPSLSTLAPVLNSIHTPSPTLPPPLTFSPAPAPASSPLPDLVTLSSPNSFQSNDTDVQIKFRNYIAHLNGKSVLYMWEFLHNALSLHPDNISLVSMIDLLRPQYETVKDMILEPTQAPVPASSLNPSPTINPTPAHLDEESIRTRHQILVGNLAIDASHLFRLTTQMMMFISSTFEGDFY